MHGFCRCNSMIRVETAARCILTTHHLKQNRNAFCRACASQQSNLIVQIKSDISRKQQFYAQRSRKVERGSFVHSPAFSGLHLEFIISRRESGTSREQPASDRTMKISQAATPNRAASDHCNFVRRIAHYCTYLHHDRPTYVPDKCKYCTCSCSRGAMLLCYICTYRSTSRREMWLSLYNSTLWTR